MHRTCFRLKNFERLYGQSIAVLQTSPNIVPFVETCDDQLFRPSLCTQDPGLFPGDAIRVDFKCV